MPIALSRLWTAFFVAVLLVPVAGVVSGLIGTQTGLTFWIMGIAAHQPVLSVTNLSSRRRLAIWLTAMTVGGITVAPLMPGGCARWWVRGVGFLPVFLPDFSRARHGIA